MPGLFVKRSLLCASRHALKLLFFSPSSCAINPMPRAGFYMWQRFIQIQHLSRWLLKIMQKFLLKLNLFSQKKDQHDFNVWCLHCLGITLPLMLDTDCIKCNAHNSHRLKNRVVRKGKSCTVQVIDRGKLSNISS